MKRLTAAVCLLIFLAAGISGAQVTEGEVRVTVRDTDGLAVTADVTVEGRSPLFEAGAATGAEGTAQVTRIPFGAYTVTIRSAGFQPEVRTVEIRSAVPRELEVVLSVAPLAAAITVTDTAPLLDTSQPTQIMQVPRRQLAESLGTTLGRSTIDVVTTLPGWLLEANAVLHPRGSEYDTQYVVDGMPVYDNRSIGFAPAFETSEFESVSVMTAGIPAEYGRRLGGVIALDTRRVGRIGHSTEFDAQFGTYANRAGSIRHQFRTGRTSISVGGHGGYTERYLDPPSIENFTNKATSGGFNFRIDHDLTSRDRLTGYLRSSETRFLVPNDLVQQGEGQRQDRFGGETSAQVHYQRIFSPGVLGTFKFMFRDLTAQLWSNPQSTPVFVEQDRGLKEGAFVANLTIENEFQTLKFGGDLRITDIREEFRFAEPDELPEFDLEYDDSEKSTEASLFVQDLVRIGDFSASVGIRYDRYDLLIEENAISPRIGLSYYVAPADLLLRASYDRIFQPPPMENLLLSSAAASLGIDEVEDAIAVPANRANFFEVGLRKPLFDTFRLDVSHYWRTFRNYIDDDVFLNTGLSFPITFDTARVTGTEVRLEMPSWEWVSSSVSYANMIGYATSPVTGGLFIEGGEAEELRDTFEKFAISQDQRNTLAAQVRISPHERVWFSTGIRYGSGLPVELEDDDDEEGEEEEEEEEEIEQPISPRILERVNFARERLRPNFSLDFSLGVRVWEQDERSVTTQFDVRNATDRLDVINFSGAFSGTALAPGRQFTFQTKLRF